MATGTVTKILAHRNGDAGWFGFIANDGGDSADIYFDDRALHDSNAKVAEGDRVAFDIFLSRDNPRPRAKIRTLRII